MAKIVRAKKTGFWDGHRRRAGAEFPVADGARESWFEDTGKKADDAELPAQLRTAQAPAPKGFVQVMSELGKASAAQPPQTLADVGQNAGLDDGSVADLT